MTSDNGQIRFSVVIPALNEARYVGAALESLARQDYVGTVELIVVDNNSTDATAAVARDLGATVLHEPVPGVCAARQRGTAAARGEIVISTDADTVHPCDWLSRIDAEFARSGEIVAVAGPCRYQNPSWWARLYPQLMFGGFGSIYAVTGRLCYLTATNTAFLRSAFPGYDLRLTQGGDELDLLRRLRPKGRVVWLSDNVVVTSPRRLQQGLFYTLFVALIAQYLIGYAVNRLAARPLVGMAPAFRESAGRRGQTRVAKRGFEGPSMRRGLSRRWWLALSVALTGCVCLALVRIGIPDAASDLVEFVRLRR